VAGDGDASGGSGSGANRSGGDSKLPPAEAGQLRGVLVFGMGDKLADMAHMLRTEVGFMRNAHVECYSAVDGKIIQLSTLPQCLEVN
jgi:hypothetical protein